MAHRVNLLTLDRDVDDIPFYRILQSDVGPFPHKQPRDVQEAFRQSEHQGSPQVLAAPLIDVVSKHAQASPHPLGISSNTSLAKEGDADSRGVSRGGRGGHGGHGISAKWHFRAP